MPVSYEGRRKRGVRGERDRETDRGRDRQTETERERQTDRWWRQRQRKESRKEKD